MTSLSRYLGKKWSKLETIDVLGLETQKSVF